jgi:uncharacterized membrane protein
MTDAAGTSPARRRWLVVALTVSLALNLFLVGVFAGHMHTRHGPPLGPRERIEHIVADLELNDAQKAAFDRFEVAFRQHSGPMRRANAEVWAKIGNPTTGQDQIAALLGSAMKNRLEFQQTVSNALGAFLATLTPAQRVKFVEEARRPAFRQGSRRP